MNFTKKPVPEVRIGDYIRRKIPGQPPGSHRTEEGRVAWIREQVHYYGGRELMAYHFYIEIPRTGIFGRKLRPDRLCISHNWANTEIEVADAADVT